VIAEVVRAEFNSRLKSQGKRPGRWKTGHNPVSRVLGKELTVLTWAIEDADPSLVSTAVANWQGLAPEERWWLYTMTAAATGNYLMGRSRGWRKALRYALTENPVTGHASNQPIVPEFFRLVSEAASMNESESINTSETGKNSGSNSDAITSIEIQATLRITERADKRKTEGNKTTMAAVAWKTCRYY